MSNVVRSCDAGTEAKRRAKVMARWYPMNIVSKLNDSVRAAASYGDSSSTMLLAATLKNTASSCRNSARE